MGLNDRSGSVNYTQDSGSAAPNFINYTGSFVIATPKPTYLQTPTAQKPIILFEKPATTTTIPGQLTVKYFQRVYDAGTEGYCYYTKTEIDPTPSAGETTPNYTGAISDHSVVRILEIF
jgi:hypothetical protein